MNIKIKLAPGGIMPSYAHDGDAGMDLYALEGGRLYGGERALVSCGFSIEIPDGYVGLVCPRSGLARDCGIGIVNAPGIVDSGYRGIVHANLIRHSPCNTIYWSWNPGDRIAQLVIVPFLPATLELADELSTTERGTGGHGSSGLR